MRLRLPVVVAVIVIVIMIITTAKNLVVPLVVLLVFLDLRVVRCAGAFGMPMYRQDTLMYRYVDTLTPLYMGMRLRLPRCHGYHNDNRR